ncbi:QacE family quaternary ammonium compound efflux SMR transporter [Streptomyces sp. CHA1]|uniref:QacE family quaternary ammonium compound efflux SMR transporter n=3 Tax=Streptomyces TaxID=1883 RepID=A0ACC7Y799_9ACTN|nr:MULTISPECIES: SMR family transporter [Streptomyces]MYW61370.1 QacE family quaternary ammonium compound efflux SMR transporter [Streptomyces sp. SID8370]MYW87317.1 QacE family quaternary ammonium compound efflux SMR transporter [Streptomyces sp. SID8371]MYX53455.1 QacE family quaternary ammonium compound efflux SMR transporter [Streptomyces sp. SID8385]MYX82673.1 QacE family quaternary ammonium compound efflux SMR transporter [Streptomyces sp. SID4915]NUW05744.1 QacE family quaternary ammoni
MTWVLLACAILAEVTATISLRLSEGFSKIAPSVVVVVGYVTAFTLLALVLKRGMAIGVAYGIWAAAGVALVALIGAAFLGDSLTPVQYGGLVLVAAGVVALEAGGAH